MGRELRKFPAIAGHQQAWAADLRAEGALFPPGPAPFLGGRGSTGPSDKGCQQIGHPLPQVYPRWPAFHRPSGATAGSGTSTGILRVAARRRAPQGNREK